jgi:hypothetical protein
MDNWTEILTAAAPILTALSTAITLTDTLIETLQNAATVNKPRP